MLPGFSLLSPALPQVCSPTITPNFFRVPAQSVRPCQVSKQYWTGWLLQSFQGSMELFLELFSLLCFLWRKETVSITDGLISV